MKQHVSSRQPSDLIDDGDINSYWTDDLHRRMFLVIERDLAILEHARLDDPKKDIRETLDLIERALRIKRLIGEAFPKRARKKRNGATQPGRTRGKH